MIRHDAPSPLFAATHARATDPGTSREAARKYSAAGKHITHAQVVLHALQAKDGQTSAEVADMTGLTRHVPARRLPDLEHSGLVRKGEPRTCAATGSRCVTWWVVR